jgi:hypothetical protein
MRDATRFAAQIAKACPLLREIRVTATALSLEYLWIDTSVPLSFCRSKWTVDIIRRSNWFRNIRPLSGLKKVSTVITDIDCYQSFNPQDRTNVSWNIHLLQSVLEQSATRAREVPLRLPYQTMLLMQPRSVAFQNSETSIRLGVRVLCSNLLSPSLQYADRVHREWCTEAWRARRPWSNNTKNSDANFETCDELIGTVPRWRILGSNL